VFLNFPFDVRYRDLYVALVSGLVLFGLKPKCVLEVSDGKARLDRLIRLLEKCKYSIHDLSRTTGRHNMPFELGLARMLQHHRPSHQIFVLDDQPYRLDKTCSDMKAFDPLVHGNDPESLLEALENKFHRSERSLKWKQVKAFHGAVKQALEPELRDRKAHDPYSSTIFKSIIEVSAVAAESIGLLR